MGSVGGEDGGEGGVAGGGETARVVGAAVAPADEVVAVVGPHSQGYGAAFGVLAVAIDLSIGVVVGVGGDGDNFGQRGSTAVGVPVVVCGEGLCLIRTAVVFVDGSFGYRVVAVVGVDVVGYVGVGTFNPGFSQDVVFREKVEGSPARQQREGFEAREDGVLVVVDVFEDGGGGIAAAEDAGFLDACYVSVEPGEMCDSFPVEFFGQDEFALSVVGEFDEFPFGVGGFIDLRHSVAVVAEFGVHGLATFPEDGAADFVAVVGEHYEAVHEAEKVAVMPVEGGFVE